MAEHKELFDQIIGEETTNDVPVDGSIQERVDAGCIPIHSCTGAIYAIDPFDPGNAELFSGENRLKNISGFSEMETSIIDAMRNLLIINEFPVEERDKYIDMLDKEFMERLTAYGMKPNYTEINPNLNTLEKVKFMAFDLLSFTKTINHFLVSMSMQSMFTLPETFMTEDVFGKDEVPVPDTNDDAPENKSYKVYGHIQPDNTVTIINIIEEDADPSEYLIVNDEDDDELDGVISLHTIAKSEADAAKDARIVFNGYIRDMIETTSERELRIADEMSAPSGLLEN